MENPPVNISPEEALKVLTEQRKNKVQKKIDESTERAAEVLHTLLDSEDVPPVVRMASAKDILDRGGFKPVEKQVIAVTYPKPIIDLPPDIVKQ